MSRKTFSLVSFRENKDCSTYSRTRDNTSAKVGANEDEAATIVAGLLVSAVGTGARTATSKSGRRR